MATTMADIEGNLALTYRVRDYRAIDAFLRAAFDDLVQVSRAVGDDSALKHDEAHAAAKAARKILQAREALATAVGAVVLQRIATKTDEG